MKILFVYFSKKQMCETAEQAIEFINSLKHRNHANHRDIVVNKKTEDLLRDVFSQEWQTDERGLQYIVLCGRTLYHGIEICTTGCGDTRIKGFPPLGETVEEHDAAMAARDLEREKSLKAARDVRMAELSVVRKGWYRVSLDLVLSVFADRGSDYFADTTFSGKIIAESGIDAYNKVVKHILSSPPEVVNYRGNMSSLISWSEPYQGGYEFTFLGVKTDDGYSMEKWEEWEQNEKK